MAEWNRAETEGRLGLNRRDFLRASTAIPAAGAFYLGYEKLGASPVRAGIVGTGNEGCAAMIAQSPPDFLQYVAYHDIRPSQIARGRQAFRKLYGTVGGDEDHVEFHSEYRKMLEDDRIEAIVIATPLSTHAALAVQALQAGKHVFCEKLMAHNVTDAKAMVRASKKFDRILAVGHQRHYSALYADALETITSGTLGQVKHIRALWHRNNTHEVTDPKTKEKRIRDSWSPDIPPDDRQAVESGQLDLAKHGYKSLEELVRWRLYRRTGGGLMAELGSHQLDACSIFLGKERPMAVSGTGGKHYFQDDRDCEDHVYCTFEFPQGVIVTYSSINTNALQGYGEIVMGTRGTLMVMHERDLLLFNERDPGAATADSRRIEVKPGQGRKDESSMYSAASVGLPAEAARASSGQEISRGYTEELQHFAYCVRHRDPANQVRCDGQRALEDTVGVLAANRAIRIGGRLVFDADWYDPDSPEVPDEVPADLSLQKMV